MTEEHEVIELTKNNTISVNINHPSGIDVSKLKDVIYNELRQLNLEHDMFYHIEVCKSKNK